VILAALDESPAAGAVLRQAASLARTVPGAELHVVHIPDRFTLADVTATTFDLGHAREYVDECMRAARASSGVAVLGHVLEKEPVAAIVDLATELDADLVVVGASSKRGPERWLFGSVAKKVAERAPCAVLVARSKKPEAATVPAIEAPCPDCVAAQKASNGARLWCARHAEHHPHAHVHYEVAEGFGAGSSLVRPETP
jgi:nucleotide-binding universal stress UspA family protein